jgi:hypothetical protein
VFIYLFLILLLDAAVSVETVYGFSDSVINELHAVGMRSGRRNRSTQRIIPSLVPLCPPQIPHDLTWDLTWAAMVGSR